MVNTEGGPEREQQFSRVQETLEEGLLQRCHLASQELWADAGGGGDSTKLKKKGDVEWTQQL